MEGTLFAISEGAPYNWTEDDYTLWLLSFLGQYASVVQSAFPLSAFQNTSYPAFYAMSNFVTQLTFFCPSRLALQATLNAGTPAYTYIWEHTPSCPWSADTGIDLTAPGILHTLGPTHTTEIPFVFNQTKHLPAPGGTCHFYGSEVELSTYLVNAWTSMAELASPGNDWPEWNDTTSIGMQFLKAASVTTIDFSVCEMFDVVLQAVEDGTAGQASRVQTLDNDASSALPSSTYLVLPESVSLPSTTSVSFATVSAFPTPSPSSPPVHKTGEVKTAAALHLHSPSYVKGAILACLIALGVVFA
jgi:Carboxylesterase family